MRATLRVRLFAVVVAALGIGVPSLAGAVPNVGTTLVCNPDASCLGDAWEKQRRATLLIGTSDGTCTGTLLNNVTFDGTPYVLTALHCADENLDGVLSATEQALVNAWEFYFEYERVCGSGTNDFDLSTHFLSGATTMAIDPSTDTILVRMTFPPPPSLHPYYAGWTTDDSIPNQVLIIHHTAGDYRQGDISHPNYISHADTNSEDEPGFYWWIEDWTYGSTDGGASGAGIYDYNTGFLIGALSGGDTDYSCNDGIAEDYAGRLDEAILNVYWPYLGFTDYLDGFDPQDGEVSTLGIPTNIGPGEEFEHEFEGTVIINAPFNAATGSEVYIHPAS